MRFWLSALCATFVASLSVFLVPKRGAFPAIHSERQIYNDDSLIVDLGYEKYQGVADSSTGLKTWKG